MLEVSIDLVLGGSFAGQFDADIAADQVLPEPELPLRILQVSHHHCRRKCTTIITLMPLPIGVNEAGGSRVLKGY